MTPERYKEVGRLYRAAVELGGAQRFEYQAEACAGDEALRAEVEALLAYDQARGFLDSSALELAARVLDEKSAQAFAGQRAGRCRLLSLLGKGGMGEVWLAEDTQLSRKVAVKLLPAQFTRDDERVRRFAQEARAASALNHPNILTIHEIGQALNTHYIVMEYVEGETLRRRLASAPQQKLNPAEALAIAIQIAEALVAAHEAGIMHRDIKPENIMLRRDGYAKVLDFGLAKLAEGRREGGAERRRDGEKEGWSNGEREGKKEGETPGPSDGLSFPPSLRPALSLARSPSLTASGMVMGTPQYMSPEQARGELVDARTDIFSLGVALYEMIAGRPPFVGATPSFIIAAILRDDPPPLGQGAFEASLELERILGRALCKDREKRYRTVKELLDDLKRLHRRLELKDELKDELARAGQQASGADGATPDGVELKRIVSAGDLATPHTTVNRRAGGLGRRGLVLLCVLAAVVAGGGWLSWRSLKLKNARAAVARIEELTRAERFFEAYDLAIEARAYLPGDPTITRLTPTFTDDLSVAADPPGARVYLKRFASNEIGGGEARQLIGVAPINHKQIARGAYFVSIEKDGYAAYERTVSGLMLRVGGFMAPSPPIQLEARLVENAKAPARMALVPGGDYRLANYGRTTDRRAPLDAYFIDKYETTNREYKEFIRAGGYLKREFWRHSISAESGVDSSWEEAIRGFKDRTGLPGPRSWANQDFPEGMGEYPVTDISWYEAAAYAAFRGKELPTAFQWEKAARGGLGGPGIGGVGYFQMPWGPFTGTIERRANFYGRGTMPVESLEFGLSPYGCFHMAGNVAEWIRNESSEGFTTAGGSWDDPPYLFGKYGSYPGVYSSARLGFRCVLNAPGAAGDQGATPLVAKTEVPVYKPASDATFRAWQQLYRYAQPPLDAQIVEVQETDDWRREKITYAGAEGERAFAYLYLPRNYPPPWQLIQYMPSGAAFTGFKSISDLARLDLAPFIKSGRAVLAVVLKGFPERERPFNFAPPKAGTIEHRDQYLQMIADERRGLDYAATRSDLDAGRVAYLAVSVRGLKLALPAIEPRYRSVIMIGVRLDPDDNILLPEINPINLLPHIRAPKLILQGRYDELTPLKSQVEPLLGLLRGPRRFLSFNAGHALPPEISVAPINHWLDETLGPVRR
jgi:serine/threonine protein kinase/formylglycine-generating enzyme required for sulfatase activity